MAVVVGAEGSLEVKLPIIILWTDGNAEVGRDRAEKESEEGRCRHAER